MDEEAGDTPRLEEEEEEDSYKVKEKKRGVCVRGSMNDVSSVLHNTQAGGHVE